VRLQRNASRTPAAQNATDQIRDHSTIAYQRERHSSLRPQMQLPSLFPTRTFRYVAPRCRRQLKNAATTAATDTRKSATQIKHNISYATRFLTSVNSTGTVRP
jgi:hypothetical protein